MFADKPTVIPAKNAITQSDIFLIILVPMQVRFSKNTNIMSPSNDNILKLNALNLAIEQNDDVSAKKLIDMLSDEYLNKSDELYHLHPIHKAILKENIEMVVYLLTREIDLNKKNNHGKDAYFYVVESNNQNILNLIYRYDNPSYSCYFCSIL